MPFKIQLVLAMGEGEGKVEDTKERGGRFGGVASGRGDGKLARDG